MYRHSQACRSGRGTIPDEPGNVHGPIDLGDLVEDGREDVVEDDLPIEPDDEIVDLRDRVEVGRRAARAAVTRSAWARASSTAPMPSSGAVGADDGKEHDCDRETGHEQEGRSVWGASASPVADGELHLPCASLSRARLPSGGSTSL